MAFSIFSRKGDTAKKDAENKPSSAKAPVARAPVPSPKEDEASGVDSLDFSTYVPPPKPASLADTGAPSRAPSPVPAVVEPPAPPQTRTPSRGPDSLQAVAVPAGERVVPLVEEVAIFFANGQLKEALGRLVGSVHKKRAGAPELQLWLMLFDLYQHLGRKAEFEELALEFVVKLERSPPAWRESDSPEDSATATGGIAYCALSGTLVGSERAQGWRSSGTPRARGTMSASIAANCRVLTLQGAGFSAKRLLPFASPARASCSPARISSCITWRSRASRVGRRPTSPSGRCCSRYTACSS